MNASAPAGLGARPAIAEPLSPAAPARVMICDDSASIRAAITRMLASEDSIRVVARVADGRAALAALERTPVDVVVLDVEMPAMDGIGALRLLLRADPGLRVIMTSTLTVGGAEVAMRALRLGAADYVPKPGVAAISDELFRHELVAKVLGLARLRRARGAHPERRAPPGPAAARPRPAGRPRLLAIGSSTGGPRALFTLVQALGRDIPIPVVLTQHMPPAFTSILASHLAALGGLPSAEARDGETLEAGHLYVAPGDRHLLIKGPAESPRISLSTDAPENFCRPAVDPMLRSAVDLFGGDVLVVMLTGMGQDGLAGTRLAVAAGGCAIAQDEATSVVWGMPGAIAQAGLCHRVLPLPAIGPAVLNLLGGTSS